jgi:bisphosphoglycerate-independent phosphoglycerate mutase (AlkP superfamily)
MSGKSILIILDGWLIRIRISAIEAANTLILIPCGHLSSCHADHSWRGRWASDGQMGNSEVGHLNIGAGRVVYREWPACSSHQGRRITKNEALLRELAAAEGPFT